MTRAEAHLTRFVTRSRVGRRFKGKRLEIPAHLGPFPAELRVSGVKLTLVKIFVFQILTEQTVFLTRKCSNRHAKLSVLLPW